MNHIILFPDEIKENLVSLPSDFRYVHVIQNLRCQIGDLLRVFVLEKGCFYARITTIDPSFIEMILCESRSASLPWFCLHVALSRPPTTKKILEHCTCLGAQEIHFYPSSLTEKSYEKSHVLQKENITNLLDLGLMQSGCYFQRPTVIIHQNFFSWKQYFHQKKNTFLLSKKAQDTFLHLKEKHPEFKDSMIHMAVGPERGLTDQEEDLILQNSRGIRISQSILRVENACYQAISQMEMFFMPRQ